jgi:hypothetical protein
MYGGKTDKNALRKFTQAVMLLTCIKKILGSNLEPDTDYPDLCLSWFTSVLPGKCSESASNEANHFFPHPFQFIIHQSFHHLMLNSLS